VGDLIPADASWVQVQLAVYELGWVHGFIGSDGTPAPYFDNVRLAAYPHHGPSLVANVADLPHDTFPESGTLDLVNLGRVSLRLSRCASLPERQDKRLPRCGAIPIVLLLTQAPAR
ncbi:MAG: hypothetical protein R6W76_16895, partial [Caldilinea sp.]